MTEAQNDRISQLRASIANYRNHIRENMRAISRIRSGKWIKDALEFNRLTGRNREYRSSIRDALDDIRQIRVEAGK